MSGRKPRADPDYRLTLEDVREWEKRHGAIAAGAIVLLETGWSARWPDKKSYLGDDTPGDASKLHFPSYGKDAAEYLVRERKVGALGVDTASIDYGASKDFIVHQIANGANVPGLENVARLDELPERGRLGDRASDEDRRRLGRAAPHRGPASLTPVAMAPPHPFGLHRSLDPPGVLPQVARRLDATPRALENEIAVAVRALSIDSASFRQLRETEVGDRRVDPATRSPGSSASAARCRIP